MRIHEAIEKAGPGGKGKCGESGWTFETDQLNATIFRTNGVITSHIPSTLIFDDQWQVIAEERIEVGDEIHVIGHPVCNEHTVCEVDSICYDGRIGFKPRIVHFIEPKSCNLIRKGSKKHVFEVQFKVITDSNGNTYVVPMGVNKCHFLYGKGLAKGPAYNFVKGKEYDMTLTERK